MVLILITVVIFFAVCLVFIAARCFALGVQLEEAINEIEELKQTIDHEKINSSSRQQHSERR